MAMGVGAEKKETDLFLSHTNKVSERESVPPAEANARASEPTLTDEGDVLAFLEQGGPVRLADVVVLENVVMRVAVASDVENVRRRVVFPRRSAVSPEAN